MLLRMKRNIKLLLFYWSAKIELTWRLNHLPLLPCNFYLRHIFFEWIRITLITIWKHWIADSQNIGPVFLDLVHNNSQLIGFVRKRALNLFINHMYLFAFGILSVDGFRAMDFVFQQSDKKVWSLLSIKKVHAVIAFRAKIYYYLRFLFS